MRGASPDRKQGDRRMAQARAALGTHGPIDPAVKEARGKPAWHVRADGRQCLPECADPGPWDVCAYAPSRDRASSTTEQLCTGTHAQAS